MPRTKQERHYHRYPDELAILYQICCWGDSRHLSIVGHSYLPPDRIFGKIEKVVKRKEVIIIDPKEYSTIFSEFATVLDMESDFDVFDWKKAVETHVKPPSQWHFQFSSAKRMIIKKEASSSG
ncbi:unnamed protein product [Psylliodes chrysocephalus]|uniref:Uncharacterized protein n=1 Tax=Psylliodes chrysocephalus TaxID=3402493 RepID=A0A9P0G4I8_9CUCU|nr:unnamed protein product [Psylliodes chrysocephala]